MTRFRPTVEALDARTLPSAVIAGADAPVLPAAQVGQLADEPTGVVGDQDDSVVAKKGTPPKPPSKPDTDHIRITLTDVLVSSYS